MVSGQGCLLILPSLCADPDLLLRKKSRELHDSTIRISYEERCRAALDAVSTPSYGLLRCMTSRESLQDTWSRFSLFLSRDVLERQYHARHGRDLSASKASEIISHLEQGREYFDSAASSGILVRPLLQYYGVLAHSRAIVRYCSPKAREANLRRSHGLSATLNSGDAVDNMRVIVSEGTFYELLQATRNAQMCTVQIFKDEEFSETKTAWRVETPLPCPLRGAGFSLFDLLGRMPQLMNLFEYATNGRSRCHRGFVAGLNGGIILPNKYPSSRVT